MKLEDQVCSLELAKRLKELGVKQDSVFYYLEEYTLVNGGEFKGLNTFKILYVGNDKHLFHRGKAKNFSTFTASELGEMLPVCIGEPHKRHYDLFCFLDHPHDWFVQYRRCGKVETALWEGLDIHCENNLANGMAKMLIHLIEKGILKP